ncbi:MAG: hypothetical protein AABX75_01960 [Nanoarchaeota archaeon]
MAYNIKITARADSGPLEFIFPFDSKDEYHLFRGFLLRVQDEVRTLKPGWTAVAWYLDGEPNKALRFIFYYDGKMEKDFFASEIDPSDALDCRPAELEKILRTVPG